MGTPPKIKMSSVGQLSDKSNRSVAYSILYLQTKLVIQFYHRRVDHEFSSVMVNGCTPKEAPQFEYLLRVKVKCIYTIHRKRGWIKSRIREPFQKASESFSHVLSLQESDQTQMCCHIWAGGAISRFFRLENLQKSLRCLVGDEIFLHPTTCF